VEACEYDRSFHNLHPTVCIITNIEADHLDCYKDLDDIIGSFRTFAEKVPADGLILANGQDANVAKAVKGMATKVETVAIQSATVEEGLTAADWVTVPVASENGCHGGIVHYHGKPVATIRLAIPGLHNLYNATMALAACNAAGADLEAHDAIPRGGGRLDVGHTRGEGGDTHAIKLRPRSPAPSFALYRRGGSATSAGARAIRCGRTVHFVRASWGRCSVATLRSGPAGRCDHVFRVGKRTCRACDAWHPNG